MAFAEDLLPEVSKRKAYLVLVILHKQNTQTRQDQSTFAVLL